MTSSSKYFLEFLMPVSAAALYYLASENFFVANKADGLSMEPTISDAGSVLCNKLSYRVLG